ncbi:MAG: hypothetical protein AAB340_00200 [Patescibacteria group bacterium]
MKKINNKTKTKTINTFSDSEFYFDDCIICQGMKKAEESGRSLNVDELKKLFKKANNQQKRL